MRNRTIIYAIVAALLAAACLGAAYTAWLNPEITWLMQLRDVKQAAAERKGPDRILLCGGSTVLFGLDSERIAQLTRRPVVNLGLHAGMGAPALLGFAAHFARPGDLLVLSVEPDLFMGAVEPMRLGNQFMVLAGLGDEAMGGVPPIEPTGPAFRTGQWLDVANPGLRQLANHLGKIITGRQVYRYSALRPDRFGYMRGKLQIPHPPSHGAPGLSNDWRTALMRFQAHMQARGVRTVYSLPWFETTLPPDDIRAACRKYLLDIGAIMPVLDDFDWQAMGDPDNFADSAGHLSLPGADMRSDALGAALASASYFVPEPATQSAQDQHE